MFFRIKPIESGYYISMISYDEDGGIVIDYIFVGSIIKYLNIKINDFDKAVKSYNGSYLEQSVPFIDSSQYKETDSCENYYTRIYFKNKNDADLFVTKYLEPQLLIKKLL